jgi:hypothetical protein
VIEGRTRVLRNVIGPGIYQSDAVAAFEMANPRGLKRRRAAKQHARWRRQVKAGL